MAVEIILASVVSITIAVFLIDITVKLVNKTDDYHVDTVFVNDKALIIKNIKEEIQNDINSNGIITGVVCSDNKCTITYTNGVSRDLSINQETSEIVYNSYTKKIDSRLSGEVNISSNMSSNNSYIVINIGFSNIFNDNDYDMIIPISNEGVKKNILIGVSGFQNETSTFLGSDVQRQNISSVTFIDNKEVPEGLTTVDVSLNQDNSILMWYTDNDNDGKYDMVIGSNDTIYASSGWFLFSYLTNATSIDLSNFNTSNMTYMRDMFYNCSSLTNLNVSNFDTSKVTDMYMMFGYCSRLTSLDVSSFDTSKVTSMWNMFMYCDSLTELDLSNFDTSKVTRMDGMFNACSSLTNIIFGEDFNTSNVTGMGFMFYSCSSLTSLDVSDFDTSNVTRMDWMFSGCNSLTSLDLSNFNTSKVTDMDSMFSGCNKLTTIDLRNADFSNVTEYGSMFYSVPTSATIYLKDTESNRTLMSNFSGYRPTYIS